MSSKWRIAFTGAAVTMSAALAGCTPIDHGLGEAVKYDMALQTIDPDPVYGPEDAQPGYHGEKGQKAVERYRKDQVKDVQQIETTDKISSGGGGPK